MAQQTAVDTNIQVGTPQLDMNRPEINLSKPIVQGMQVLVDAFKPKGYDPNALLNSTAQAYTNQISELEDSGQLNNTTINKLNRSTKLNFMQQLGKVDLPPEEVKKYIGLL